MVKDWSLQWWMCILSCAVLVLVLAVPSYAGYGGGDGGGGSGGGGDGGNGGPSGGSAGLDKLSKADLIRMFGTPAMVAKLDAKIKEHEGRLKAAREKHGRLKDELDVLKEKIARISRDIKDGDNSTKKEMEYFEAWREAMHKQHALKRMDAERQLAQRNLKKVSKGLEPYSKDVVNGYREFAKRQADTTFKANQMKMADTLLEYKGVAMDEVSRRDRQILRWTVVKYASMAAGATVSGVAIVVKAGQFGMAALSAAEASKLLAIAGSMDVAGAGIGAAADSHFSGNDVTESLVRGMSASLVQAVAGEVLGEIPGSTTAARNALMEFVKANGMDKLQSALSGLGNPPKSKPQNLTPAQIKAKREAKMAAKHSVPGVDLGLTPAPAQVLE
jgi:hypothetical protein